MRNQPAGNARTGGESGDGRRGLPPPIDEGTIDRLLSRAFDEDGLPAGEDGEAAGGAPERLAGRWLDLTSNATVPADLEASAGLLAKGRGVLSGLDFAERALRLCDPGVAVERAAVDGERIEPGEVVLLASGNARALLFAERTLLNFVQRMSGIATLTAKCVSACAGRVRVLDTRKTTPGLRVIEKYAVRCGGGENHRVGLWDEVMVKNNHVDLAGTTLKKLVARTRRSVGPEVRITAEARNAEEALAGIAGGADVILLDNFTPVGLLDVVPELRDAAEQRGRSVELEASGGLTLKNLPHVSATGIDRVSLGALTHSAPALDFSFGLEPQGRARGRA